MVRDAMRHGLEHALWLDTGLDVSGGRLQCLQWYAAGYGWLRTDEGQVVVALVALRNELRGIFKGQAGMH